VLWQPSRVMQFEKVSVSATLAAVDEGLSGVLAVFYDGDPERGGEAFDAELIPHIRANDRLRRPGAFPAAHVRRPHRVRRGAGRGGELAHGGRRVPPPPFAEVSGKAEQLGVPGAIA